MVVVMQRLPVNSCYYRKADISASCKGYFVNSGSNLSLCHSRKGIAHGRHVHLGCNGYGMVNFLNLFVGFNVSLLGNGCNKWNACPCRCLLFADSKNIHQLQVVLGPVGRKVVDGS